MFHDWRRDGDDSIVGPCTKQYVLLICYYARWCLAHHFSVMPATKKGARHYASWLLLDSYFALACLIEWRRIGRILMMSWSAFYQRSFWYYRPITIGARRFTSTMTGVRVATRHGRGGSRRRAGLKMLRYTAGREMPLFARANRLGQRRNVAFCRAVVEGNVVLTFASLALAHLFSHANEGDAAAQVIIDISMYLEGHRYFEVSERYSLMKHYLAITYFPFIFILPC